MSICNNAANAVANDDNNFGSLTCNNFQEFATKFQSAAKAAKCGTAFGVLAAICAIVGLYFQRNKRSTILAVQGFTGFCFIIVFIMTLITLGQASNTQVNSPYTTMNNIIAFGCFPAYKEGEADFINSHGGGGVLTIIALILSATMGGISLTFAQCFNPCCCPCCFEIAEDSSTQTPMIQQGNGDNYGDGVKV